MGSPIPLSVLEEVQKDFMRMFPERRWDQLGWPKLTNDVSEIGLFNAKGEPIELNLFSDSVSAGFPSPASDHIQERLNIHKYLVTQENSTFYATVGGYSMVKAGLNYGAKAVIDRVARRKLGSRVLAVVDGEFTMKLLYKGKDGWPLLVPASEGFESIQITEFTSFEIWGVITGTFQKFND